MNVETNVIYTLKGCWTAIFMFRTTGRNPIWLKNLVAISVGNNLKASDRAKKILAEVA
jgi:hypothetical protein